MSKVKFSYHLNTTTDIEFDLESHHYGPKDVTTLLWSLGFIAETLKGVHSFNDLASVRQKVLNSLEAAKDDDLRAHAEALRKHAGVLREIQDKSNLEAARKLVEQALQKIKDVEEPS